MVYYRSSPMRNYGLLLKNVNRDEVEAQRESLHLTDARRTRTYELFARSLDFEGGRVCFPSTRGALNSFTFDFKNWGYYSLDKLLDIVKYDLETDLWCLEQDEDFATSAESDLQTFIPTTLDAVNRLDYLVTITPEDSAIRHLYDLMFDCHHQCLKEQKKVSIEYKNIKKYEKSVEKLMVYLKQLRVIWYFQMLPFSVQ